MDRIRYGGPRFVLIGLYTDHAQCWNVGCRLQLKCDGARWRTWGGRWRGETGVWSGWPSTFHASSKHGVSSITTADAVHLGCQQSTSKWRPPPGRFKWTRSVSRERRNLVSAHVLSHFKSILTRYLAGHSMIKISLCFSVDRCILQTHHVTFDIGTREVSCILTLWRLTTIIGVVPHR